MARTMQCANAQPKKRGRPKKEPVQKVETQKKAKSGDPGVAPSKDKNSQKPSSSGVANLKEQEPDVKQPADAESSETPALPRTRAAAKREQADANEDAGHADNDVKKEAQQKQKPSPRKRRQTRVTDFKDEPESNEQQKAEQESVDADGKGPKQAEGSETKQSVSDDAWEVVERGIVHFLYRPKVQSEQDAFSDAPAAESFDDIQRTHMILLPKKSDDTHDAQNVAWRQITLGKKRMPKPEAALAQGQEPGGIGGAHSEAIWATVAEVGDNLDDISDNMKETTNQTKTRGLRVNGCARPAGRGHYLLSIRQAKQASQREVRLSYYLSHPSEQEFGPVQEALGLEAPCASIMMQMRNPTLPQTGPGAPPAGLPADQRVELSDAQMKETFGGSVKESNGEGGGNRYGRPERMDLLDSSGIELLLIAKDAKTEEHDVAADGQNKKELKKLAEKDGTDLDDKDVLKELGMSATEFPVDALAGKWI